MVLIKLELTPNDFSLLHASVWLEKEKLGNDVSMGVGLRERFESLLNKLNSKENLDALNVDVHAIRHLQLQRNVYVWECQKCFRRFRSEEEVNAIICGFPDTREQTYDRKTFNTE